jgi:predicted dehydrogenase
MLTRRQFIKQAGLLAAFADLGSRAAASNPQRRFRAAIIGHTGCGNYGHDQDLVFNDWDNITVVAVADVDASGRARAGKRAHALRQYADYRQMLETEKPDLVCVAPRWTGEHHAMAMAALRVGAHVYMEKPITRTLSQADEVLSAAKAARRKIAVAHQMRLAENILALKRAIEGGLLGELQEIRAHGKQDQRAGGEDLIVLGVHLFDLMRFFAGDALWCTARILQGGQEITPQDGHAATEDIGPVAGDEIDAHFAFSSGVNARFISSAKYREAAGPWGMELVGTKARIQIQMAMLPKIFLRKLSSQGATEGGEVWLASENERVGPDPEGDLSLATANQRVMRDWLKAIVENGEPVCSGYAAMKALEMAMAVFAAGVAQTRVELPLVYRDHPLEPNRTK